MLEAKKRDFQLKFKDYLLTKDTIKVVNKSEIIGYWISPETYEALQQANSPMLTKVLTNELENVNNSESEYCAEEETPKDECELCHKITECKKTWEEGEERKVCYDCILARYGKLAKRVWAKMA